MRIEPLKNLYDKTMNALIQSDAPVKINGLGLQVEGELSFDQWSDVGEQLGRVARTSLFWVGDWLNYGQDRWNGGQRFQKMAEEQRERFEQAMRLTGLELSTLHGAAHVSRRIPIDLRSPQLSFEHHRLISRVRDEDQRRDWIRKTEGSKLTTRRLRKSINGDRVVRAAEADVTDQKGRKSHLFWIKRLIDWWAEVKEEPIHADMTREQLESVLDDFGPILGILDEIRLRADKAESFL